MVQTCRSIFPIQSALLHTKASVDRNRHKVNAGNIRALDITDISLANAVPPIQAERASKFFSDQLRSVLKQSSRFWNLMKIHRVSIIAAGLVAVVVVITGVFLTSAHVAHATQADDTTVRINGYTPGVTPFISNLHLTASNTTVVKSIQFMVTPKPGAVSRPLSATYAKNYLVSKGFENPQTGDIVLPVYGLYDGYVILLDLLIALWTGRPSKLTPGSIPPPSMMHADTII